ncbi:MAG TPA: protein phosphatase 2C domain-containing protein [Burkholderiaceae bacterium]|nr:protein phosphatase 2C domain-containing protein [Burkholderiaceae bacterium]
MTFAGSPITPLEPVQGPRELVAPDPGAECVYTAAGARIEMAVASSCGSLHDRNEDAFSPPGGSARLFVVADGVGGGALAGVASRELVSKLHAALDPQRITARRVDEAVLEADRAISRRIAQEAQAAGAATVALCAPANLLASKWLVAWVGDCRVYRISAAGHGQLQLLTQDDSFRHLEETPPDGSTLDDPARMVGNGATTGANIAYSEMASGDLLALCSDGVHKYLAPDHWLQVLERPLALLQRCVNLIALARHNGSVDDATLMLLRHGGLALPGTAYGAEP